MKAKANLYRTIYLSDCGGYVVYRHCFDEKRCSVADGARAHRQAVFVAEDAANEYCDHRNKLIDKRGSDAL
jgi:hypothetical protein